MVAARAARAANHFSVLHQTRRHSVSLDHRYLDDGASGTASDAYNVSVTVDDGHGGTDSVSGTITVANLPPVISTVTGPSHPLALGTAATVSVNFSDVGTLDTHTVRFNWDDGTDDTVGASSSASHTYAKAGVYTVRVTVTDDDTGAASTSYEFVVVFDPNGGDLYIEVKVKKPE